MARRFTVRPRNTVIFSLSVLGAALSAALLVQHARGSAGSGLLAAVCGGEGGGCDKVLSSRWAVFPPRAEGLSGNEDLQDRPDPADERSIPVAALGLFYFSILAIWFGAIGTPSASLRWLEKLAAGFCGIGCLGSLAFIGIMKLAIGTWCPFCLASHAANLSILAALVLFRARPAEPAPDPKRAGRKEGRGTPAPPGAPHPSPRVAALAAALAIAVVAAEWMSYRALALGARVDEWGEIIRRHAQDADLLVLTYFRGEQQEKLLKPRDDDPIIGPEKTGTRMTLVYFSDMDCPHCAKFDRFLFEEIKPIYQGRLRIVFKHYPLNPSCNPHVASMNHRHACVLAQALEAARLQGGAAKFWALHDLLLARPGAFEGMDFAAVAAEIGLDPSRFVVDMKSQAVAARIREDIDLGRRLGVVSTPAVFLNSRPVDRLMRDLPGFWKAVSRGIVEQEGKP